MSQLGELEQLILFAVLNLGSDAFGVSIREEIERKTGRVISSGAIYTALGRMENRGFVKSRQGKPVGGRPGRPRKFYTMTKDGAVGLRSTYNNVRNMAGGLLPNSTG